MQHTRIIAEPEGSPNTGLTPTSDGAELLVSAVEHKYSAKSAPVLTGIDLKVAPGEVVALIGRSGCGKSTLLHIIAGLISPTDGAIHMNNHRVEKPSPDRVMMFQAPSLFPWMTVAQNAGLGLRYAGKSDPAKVTEVLTLVDLAEYADRNVQDLSGGQQQRVALARSLATEPALLLLDEPFSALDIFTRRALQSDVRRIAKATGLTLILVTHDISEAVMVADRAVLLKADPGRIAGDTAITVAETERATQTGSYLEEVARLTELYADIAGQTLTTNRREE
jgi:NitT/TauT family transport system ATP-binding protein